MTTQPSLLNQQNSDYTLFNEQSGIRKQRYQNERYFSIVDIVGILSGSNNPRRYWSDLKIKLNDEGGFSELYEKIVQLKFLSADGKKYASDATNTANALRIIQSIPSPNAEPLKRRLASLGNERLEEMNNPELGVERARARAIRLYKHKGMTDDRIKKRMQGIETRNLFTDELRMRGIESGIEYAIITNKTYKIFGDDVDASDIKAIKGLSPSDSVRDNMTAMEIQLTQMAEAGAKEIMEGNNAEGFDEVGACVDQSVAIMRETREKFELASKRKMLSSQNNLSEKQKEKRKKK